MKAAKKMEMLTFLCIASFWKVKVRHGGRGRRWAKSWRSGLKQVHSSGYDLVGNGEVST